jgi:deoxyribose-phosphate aldolase
MKLERLIDHTLLKPDCTGSQIKELCAEAINHNFAAVCVPPYYVKDAASLLEKHDVKVSTVIGYPLGYAATPAKVEEIKRAIDEGADEMDAVINLCAVKNANWNYLRNEMESLTTVCHIRGKIVKVILETGLLSKDEIIKICSLVTEAKADFVKTSTGFNGPGASVEVVQLLRQQLPASIKIKASGGIRDRHTAEQLIAAGANRIGTSASLALLAKSKN